MGEWYRSHSYVKLKNLAIALSLYKIVTLNIRGDLVCWFVLHTQTVYLPY